MNIALVLAGGTGTRLGTDIPKQYLKVKDKMIITYCLETFLQLEYIDAVVVVADLVWQGDICADMKRAVNASDQSKFRGFSCPGANRQMSIYNGLESILKFAHRDAKVLIHDAARPLISKELLSRCFSAYEGHDGVMPVLPMKDTVYMSQDGQKVASLLQRECVFAGQSPELFNLGKYYDACKALLPDKILCINGSTEPAIMEGLDIAMVSGDEKNFKITTLEDLDRFCKLVEG
ncbi:MAG: 2-C-methyl-D-erythritol 4-phosphate cytidylyltransferase [Lachnospiraceae bacterium]|nr:2-C-methyl-D-erythritol 4-phosphate cytidylyltransferase [Lachnospiraceae bacterium]